MQYLLRNYLLPHVSATGMHAEYLDKLSEKENDELLKKDFTGISLIQNSMWASHFQNQTFSGPVIILMEEISINTQRK